MMPQDQTEKINRTARTNFVTGVVWRRTSSRFTSFKCVSLNKKVNRSSLKDQPLMAYKRRGMLRFLRVRNFALIDKLEIHLDNGFNLLSGETGARKSIIRDAL